MKVMKCEDVQDFILGPIIDGLEAITDLTEDLAEG